MFSYLSWPADPSQLSEIRHQLRRCLAALPLTSQREDEVILAVNAAATNAIEHAYDDADDGVVELSYWTEADTRPSTEETSTEAICIEVTDHGRWRPPPRPAPAYPAGRGIRLMHGLMDSVLIHYDRRGTRVLLRHPIGQPAPQRAPIHSIPAPTPGTDQPH